MTIIPGMHSLQCHTLFHHRQPAQATQRSSSSRMASIAAALLLLILLPSLAAAAAAPGGTIGIDGHGRRQLQQAAACPQRAGRMVRYVEVRNLETSTCTGTSGGNGGYVLGFKGRLRLAVELLLLGGTPGATGACPWSPMMCTPVESS